MNVTKTKTDGGTLVEVLGGLTAAEVAKDRPWARRLPCNTFRHNGRVVEPGERLHLPLGLAQELRARGKVEFVR